MEIRHKLVDGRLILDILEFEIALDQAGALKRTILAEATARAARVVIVNCDKVGTNSLVVPSVRVSPARAISCGVKAKSAGQFTIWAKNEDVDVDPEDVAWEFIAFNPV